MAKLESEAFLIGIWKDYDQLESSMSMQELTSTLKIKRAKIDEQFSSQYNNWEKSDKTVIWE